MCFVTQNQVKQRGFFFFTAFEEKMKLPKRKITKLKQIHITEVIEGEIVLCQRSQKKLNMMLFVAWNWLKLFQQF
jgi:hypothetical protein